MQTKQSTHEDLATQGIRVFLLDDHEVVRSGLRELLTTAGMTVVGEAGTGQQTLDRIPALAPDVAVLDVNLPDGDGVSVCREIRTTQPEVECLIFTSFDDDRALANAVMAGAKGFILKQIRMSDLVGAIQRVANGEDLIDAKLRRRAAARLAKEHEDGTDRLTKQERRILEFIAEGLTNREIAERMFLGEKTVKNYVSNVLAKLGMKRRTEAAVFAIRHQQESTDQSG